MMLSDSECDGQFLIHHFLGHALKGLYPIFHFTQSMSCGCTVECVVCGCTVECVVCGCTVECVVCGCTVECVVCGCTVECVWFVDVL